ncbi:urease accessory protein UreF [Gemmobacter denitrificans]|uniref:Urease accessory protein UreF n=1 Tax=Gemmobacter denitrificans TaxID=3123040 RepID=A0ABU8BXI3_9RHOB
MVMDAPLATATEARLRIAQLLSPAFPTGGFAYSGGTEWAMDAGWLRDGAGIAGWIADSLAHGTLWLDAVLLALALHQDADHAALDDLARALCLSAERLTETLDQGAAFAGLAAGLTGTGGAPAALPVAVGRACAGLGLPKAEVIALFLQGQALNLILAAVRFLPLGPAEGQRILAALAPQIIATAQRAAEADEQALGTCAWGAEIAQMRHETLQTRIFRT